ncbi:MAG: Holliday junction resolvase Hjc [Candidatus Nanoarchaeia archaeon]|jgi:Holliday junction resolvase
MAHYSKGAAYERELMAILGNKGFAVARIAGSGKAKVEEPDLIAGNCRLILAIECKYSSTLYKTVNMIQANDLVKFANMFGAKAILAFRFAHTAWKFMELTQAVTKNVSIKKTDKLMELNELLGE